MLDINTNKSQLDIDYIYAFLSQSYWASDRSIEAVKKSIDNSLCFGVYLDKKQIGFARIVTDTVVFSYLMDVFIDPNFQGKKYGEKLLEFIYNYKDLKHVKSNYLHTKDAQEFYIKLGFKAYPTPKKFMIKQFKI